MPSQHRRQSGCGSSSRWRMSVYGQIRGGWTLGCFYPKYELRVSRTSSFWYVILRLMRGLETLRMDYHLHVLRCRGTLLELVSRKIVSMRPSILLSRYRPLQACRSLLGKLYPRLHARGAWADLQDTRWFLPLGLSQRSRSGWFQNCRRREHYSHHPPISPRSSRLPTSSLIAFRF